MIRKPPEAQRRSRAHAAAGHAVDLAIRVRRRSDRVARVIGATLLTVYIALMAFGLIESMSSLPSKLVGLVLLGGLVYWVWAFVRRRWAA